MENTNRVQLEERENKKKDRALALVPEQLLGKLERAQSARRKERKPKARAERSRRKAMAKYPEVVVGSSKKIHVAHLTSSESEQWCCFHNLPLEYESYPKWYMVTGESTTH